MGSPSFVLYMTIFVTAWIVANVVLAKVGYAWDEYPFILLNLAFSTQASYSAPLIMLAQNRQDDRDRVTAEQDRQRAERNLADTEYLTREIAALRLAMNDVATRDFVRSEMRDLLLEIVAEERNLIQAAAQQQAEFAQRQAQLDAQQQLNNPNHD
jgi:integral membrane protein